MKRENAVTVRLSDRELDELDVIAKNFELSLSETVRMLIGKVYTGMMQREVEDYD